MAIELSKLLCPDCIELDLSGKKKPEIIRELVNVISRCEDISDADSLYQAIMERENLSSTGIGNGIAIPHCMTSQVETTRMAFGRKTEGVKFDAVDNQPVSLFFLLAGTEGNPNLHLQILSKLARYLHGEGFCRSLLEAGSPSEVLEAFRTRENL